MTESTVLTCAKCSNPMALPGSYGDVTDFKITCPTPSCMAVNVVTRIGDKITKQYLEYF